MPPTTPDAAIPALDALRRPIRAFTPEQPGDEPFKAEMLDFCDDLEDLWSQDADETLESEVLWTALYSFPALVLPGPRPQQLVDLMLRSEVTGAETADTLHTLGRIRRVLTAFEPGGFAGALWRAVLLAIYSLIEHFVVLDHRRGIEECFALLDAAEAITDKLTGRA